jgi:hypothetical protein
LGTLTLLVALRRLLLPKNRQSLDSTGPMVPNNNKALENRL